MGTFNSKYVKSRDEGRQDKRMVVKTLCGCRDVSDDGTTSDCWPVFCRSAAHNGDGYTVLPPVYASKTSGGEYKGCTPLSWCTSSKNGDGAFSGCVACVGGARGDRANGHVGCAASLCWSCDGDAEPNGCGSPAFACIDHGGCKLFCLAGVCGYTDSNNRDKNDGCEVCWCPGFVHLPQSKICFTPCSACRTNGDGCCCIPGVELSEGFCCLGCGKMGDTYVSPLAVVNPKTGNFCTPLGCMKDGAGCCFFSPVSTTVERLASVEEADDPSARPLLANLARAGNKDVRVERRTAKGHGPLFCGEFKSDLYWNGAEQLTRDELQDAGAPPRESMSGGEPSAPDYGTAGL